MRLYLTDTLFKYKSSPTKEVLRRAWLYFILSLRLANIRIVADIVIRFNYFSFSGRLIIFRIDIASYITPAMVNTAIIAKST